MKKNTGKSLDELIRSFAKQSVDKRKEIMRKWQKAKQNYISQNTDDKPFNPTTMDYDKYLNYLFYLKINLIDEQIEGNQRDFVPTQDYMQEFNREFRRKGIDPETVAEINADMINDAISKVKYRDAILSETINFLDMIECESPTDNSWIEREEKYERGVITKIWD